MRAGIKMRCRPVSNSSHLASNILSWKRTVHFVIFVEFLRSFELFSNSRDDHLFHGVITSPEFQRL